MNTVYQYLQSGRVIRTYKKNLHLLQPFNEYQHFVSRLHVIGGVQTAKEVYGVKVEELESLLKMTPEQVFDLTIKEDSNGYLDKLKEKNDPKIKKYLYVCRIIDDYNILRRNNQVIDGEIKQAVYDLLDDKMIDFMCEESKDEYLRMYEGTLCVNGIGYLLYLWGDQPKKKVIETFIDLYKYYLDKVWGHELDYRDYVYGLTHCVICVSDFYTKNVNNQIHLFQETYPIGELYDSTIGIIVRSLRNYTKTGTSLSLSTINSDMLAELLVVYKLLLDDYPSNKWYDCGYVISKTYQELCNRIDSRGYIRDHKEEDLALDLKRNEHTNILFILYSRL